MAYELIWVANTEVGQFVAGLLLLLLRVLERGFLFSQPLITFSPSMFEMEWSGDGDGTDYSTTSSPPQRHGEQRSDVTRGPGMDMDSLSEELEDDLMSDDFSLPDSEDEEEDDARRELTSAGNKR